MSVMTQSRNPYVSRPQPRDGGLVEIIDLILDKGLVIDLYVRVSVIGIEILTIDARIVIASVDTYLRWAEAVNRLDLQRQEKDLPQLVQELREGGAKKETEGALEGVGEKLRDVGEKGKEAVRSRPSPRRRRQDDDQE